MINKLKLEPLVSFSDLGGLDETIKQLKEMTGGASDIAAFMKKMATERNSVRSKLETNHHHIKKVGDVVDNTQDKHGKILEDLVKRTILTEKKQ